MSTSQTVFGTWLRTRIAPLLRERGFSGSGQDFHRRVGRNWQAINIQRSKWSNADQVEFTINLGTASAAVLAAAREDPDEPQREVVCHWRTRIGSLLPRRDDLADRLDAPGRGRLVATIRARHADAVGHERPALGHVLRQRGAA